MNSLMGRCNDKSSNVEKLELNNIKLTDPREIANSFSKYYSEIGKQYAERIPSTNINHMKYVNECTRIKKSMFISPTTPYEVDKIIANLPNKTSCGLDGISNILLKKIKETIVHPLYVIFQKSFEEGIFPEKLKHAKISPLYKARERYLLVNYRPISLLITISKCLERLMHVRIVNFLELNDIFYTRQYGFRKKRSTIHAILDLVGIILKAHEEGKFTGCIFLDLSKAFDTIQHHMFLQKLQHYGIRGKALNWVESYLTNREHLVSINNTLSEPCKTDIGCPQGSIVGPLYYIIFVNCIQNVSKLCEVISFADDTTIIYSDSKISEIKRVLENELEKFILYFRTNKLSINITKTNYILFTTGKPITDIDTSLQCRVTNSVIPSTNYCKFLGVLIDKDLTWNYHVNELCNKLNKFKFLITNMRDKVGLGNSIKLYYAFFYSHLTYGIQAWGKMITKANEKRLFVIQKKVLCKIKQVGYRYPSDKLFESLELLKLSDIILYWLYKINIEYVMEMLPETIKLHLKGDHDRRPTRNSKLPVIPRHKTQKFGNSYLVQIRSKWTNAPENIKNCKTKYQLKQAIKLNLKSA